MERVMSEQLELGVECEIWKPVTIPEFADRYDVSNMGRVRSWHATGGQGALSECPKMMRIQNGPKGYPSVSMWRNGKGRSFLVSHLVSFAFIGPRPGSLEVAHIDGDRKNSRAGNLAYKSKAENELDKLRHGTRLSGEKHNMSKLTRADVREIRVLVSAGRARRVEIAEMFSVCINTVTLIAKGRTWKDAGGPLTRVEFAGVRRGEDHGNTRLTAPQVRDIRSRHATGESIKSIASEFPASRATVGRIVHRQSWAHLE